VSSVAVVRVIGGWGGLGWNVVGVHVVFEIVVEADAASALGVEG
jgi:hypothetical protein